MTRPTTTRLLAALADQGRSSRMLASRLERLRLRGPSYLARGRLLARDQMAALDRRRDETYRHLWNHAAGEVGARVEEFSTGFFRFSRDGAETIAFRDCVMLDSPATTTLAADKPVVQRLLQEAGVPVAMFTEARADDRRTLLDFLEKSGGPCVVKSARGTGGGQGVTCGVRRLDDLLQAWMLSGLYSSSVLIEEQIRGDEYRLLFLDGELLGAVRRRIPGVVGDGRRSIRELIAATNEARVAGGPEEVSRLINVDLDCQLALANAGVTLGTVLEEGTTVSVKGSASENGRRDNETWDRFAPELVEAAARAAAATKLRLAGIDVVTADPMRPLEEVGGAILEVNATPGLRHHYQVASLTDRVPVAVPLLETLLAEAR